MAGFPEAAKLGGRGGLHWGRREFLYVVMVRALKSDSPNLLTSCTLTRKFYNLILICKMEIIFLAHSKCSIIKQKIKPMQGDTEKAKMKSSWPKFTGEAQPFISERSVSSVENGLERAHLEEGSTVKGHYKGVVWTKAERKGRGCGFKRGYGRDRWADLVTAQTGARAEDLPGILKPGRIDGATKRRNLRRKVDSPKGFMVTPDCSGQEIGCLKTKGPNPLVRA